MNHIHCYLSRCVHNRDRSCSKNTVSILYKTSNEFCCGERVCYAACEDYSEGEEREDEYIV